MTRFASLFVLLFCAANLQAQFDEKVSIGAARVEPATVAPGAEARLILEVVVAEGWHIYSVAEHDGQTATTISLKTEGVSRKGAVVEPEPHVDKQDWGTYYTHEGKVVFEVPVTIGKDLKGDLRIRGELGYMACDASSCEPPASVSFTAKLKVGLADEGTQEPTGPGVGVDVSSLKKLFAEASQTQIDAVLDQIDRLKDRLEQIEGAVVPQPEFAPLPPEWEFEQVEFELLDRQTRGSEGVRGKLSFTTPEEVHLEKATEIYIDFGKSERLEMAEALEVESDGKSHSVEFVLRGKELARSGMEKASLQFSIPFEVGGNVFEKEISGLETEVEFGLPSMWGWMLKSALAALLALLTPCVFPMIPITVSVFTKQAEKQHRNPIVMPIVYVVGIVVSFVAIGTAFTALLGASDAQQFFANGWLQGAFGLLFVAFSLSLFGMFNLRPPAFLMNKAGQAQGRGDLAGTLLMGLLFSGTSFTCTAPLVGLILVAAAETGEWQFPIVGMFVFALVLAIPFFFLALFPRFLASMPKSGGWMNRVKATLGFLELAFALKFIGAMDAYLGWGIFTRESILWMWTVIFMMNGFYLLGFVNFKHDMKPEKIGGIAGSVAVGLIILGLHTMQGAYGRSMPYLMESLLPPSLEETGTGVLGWANHTKNDLEEAVALAKTHDAALFIDFTGTT